MGLTLHYKLRAPAGLAEAAIPALVARMQAAATVMRRAGRIERVGKIAGDPDDLHWLGEWLQVSVRGEENCSRGVEVPALAGHVFTVLLGEGCEPLRLGLCRYPDRVPDHQTGTRVALPIEKLRDAGKRRRADIRREITQRDVCFMADG